MYIHPDIGDGKRKVQSPFTTRADMKAIGVANTNPPIQANPIPTYITRRFRYFLLQKG